MSSHPTQLTWLVPQIHITSAAPEGSDQLPQVTILAYTGAAMRIEGWRCGFSTLAISGIISGAANKILLKAFTQVQVTYNRIAEQRDFSNFHQHELRPGGIIGRGYIYQICR